MSTKPTNTENPKDAIGQTKLPMDLVPESAIAELTTAFLEGAQKYGRFNWRAKGVRASIYVAAAKRHLAKWYNGQDEDEKTTVNHLASVMACCAIILDAQVCGKLNDDRPPRAPVSEHIDKLSKKVSRLAELFKDEHPHQYTIADSEPEPNPVPKCGGAGEVFIDGEKVADIESWKMERAPCSRAPEKKDECPKFLFPDYPIRRDKAFGKELEALQRLNNPPTPGVRFEIKDKEKLAAMQKLEDRISGFYQKYTLEQIDNFLTIAAERGIDPFTFIDGVEKATRDLRRVEECEKAAREISEWSKKYDKQQVAQAALDRLYRDAEEAEHRYFSWLDDYGYYLNEGSEQ